MASAKQNIPSANSPQGSASVEIVRTRCATDSPKYDSAGVIESSAMANQELAAAFDRYLQARGFKPATRVSYGKSVVGLVESLGTRSVVEADRALIREFLNKLYGRGLDANTIRRHTAGLRCFFKFIQLSRLSRHDPTVMLSHRKLPGRVPRVLTLKEIERLIAAAKSPLETAVSEFLYGTGVRVSELAAMRLEDVDFATGVARVKKGKGGKDRIVLFGRGADAALRRMIEARPPETGFLFEARQRTGFLTVQNRAWCGRAYVNSIQQFFRIGPVSDFPTRADARGAFDLILAVTPGYRPKPPRPYTDRAIRLMLTRMGVRAGIGRVYPHALRRAMASHMLERGADLRVIQDLLGHERVTTTALYTSLSAMNLKEIHTRCHPTAGASEDAETK
jgi:site-specific recombinase XerD